MSQDIGGNKFCSRCNTTKSVEEFSYYVRRPDKRWIMCKACDKARNHMSRQARLPQRRASDNARYDRAERRQEHRNRTYIRSYGITIDAYNDMYLLQKGMCRICGKADKHFTDWLDQSGGIDGPRPKRLCIDHNHETGAIRGLLCGSCNRGIGLLGDNSDVLRRAITYLEAYNEHV